MRALRFCCHVDRFQLHHRFDLLSLSSSPYRFSLLPFQSGTSLELFLSFFLSSFFLCFLWIEEGLVFFSRFYLVLISLGFIVVSITRTEPLG